MATSILQPLANPPRALMKKLSIALLLCLAGCSGTAAPSEPASPSTPTAPLACPEAQQEWVHMPVIVGAQPPSPMEDEQVAILDEVVASIRARPDIVHLRVEGHGCDGEAPERTAARATFVRDRLVERGIPPAMMSTAGYGRPRRGCYCPCEAFEEPAPPDAKRATDKNCAMDLDGCRQRRHEYLSVQFSVIVCHAPPSP